MRILFICTGNYYRSRFAQYVFNDAANRRGLSAAAISRGLQLGHPDNVGNLSPHVLDYLKFLDVETLAMEPPLRLELQDLIDANRIIVMDEKEHRPMISKQFPGFETMVEYWRFEDEYLVEPGKMLPLLEQRILALVDELMR